MPSKIFVIITSLVFGQLASAASPEISAFRQFKDVDQLPISVPTVVEVPFDQEFVERFDFAVLDKSTDAFQPYYFKQKTLTNQIVFTVSSDNNSNTSSMVDGNFQTFDSNAGYKTVLAKTSMLVETVRFPKTSASQWFINFTYSQPLRIAELRLAQENAVQVKADALRFLAQPNREYQIYFDSDMWVSMTVGESANLTSDQDVLKIGSLFSQRNQFFVRADIDGDNIPDVNDNCVSEANTDQADINANGRGDACDDFDRDGLINSQDNCPDQPNNGQQDTDSDKIGDACDNEESRLTERLPWLPWLGIGFAAIVLIVMFVTALKSGIKGPE